MNPNANKSDPTEQQPGGEYRDPDVQEILEVIRTQATQAERLLGVIAKRMGSVPPPVPSRAQRRAREPEPPQPAHPAHADLDVASGSQQMHALKVPSNVVSMTQPVDLRGRIETALTRESLDTARLAKTVGESIEKVTAVMRDLRAERKVFNMGYEDTPMWTWRVGNDVDTPTLTRVVKRLISERPMWLRDIVNATGAKDSRVSGVLVELQRNYDVRDMAGSGHGKQYLLLSEKVRDARLPPKVVRRGNKKSIPPKK